MVRVFVAVFLILHGLVHLWYFTLSQGLVAFQPEMGWTGRSWLFSPLFGNSVTRWLAGILYVAATLIFVAGGIGLIARAGWGAGVLVGAALLSSALIVLFWEGGLSMSMQKGVLGLLINVVLLIVLLVLRPASLAS